MSRPTRVGTVGAGPRTLVPLRWRNPRAADLPRTTSAHIPVHEPLPDVLHDELSDPQGNRR
ncbi:hypothetical protein AB2L28_03670 [Kineococcus sp. TBRC 1896]|uniref:Uncharacterized protein n=1 Tax=Kineococcus mangrovi TaxID=1660183 RepID=A0ABV4HY36_9ACTN